MTKPHTAAQADDPLRDARELADLVGTIAQRLDNAARYARRTRILSVVAVLLLMVCAGLGLAAYSNGQAVHDSQLRACQIGNDARNAQRLLWNHVLDLSSRPRPGETPAQRQARLLQAGQFRVYIRKHFHPVDCSKLYP